MRVVETSEEWVTTAMNSIGEACRQYEILNSARSRSLRGVFGDVRWGQKGFLYHNHKWAGANLLLRARAILREVYLSRQAVKAEKSNMRTRPKEAQEALYRRSSLKATARRFGTASIDRILLRSRESLFYP